MNGPSGQHQIASKSFTLVKADGTNMESAVAGVSPPNASPRIPVQPLSEMPSSAAGQPVYLIKDTDWGLDGLTTLNLILVFALFVWSSRDRKRERREDDRLRRDQERRNVTNFWVQEVISRPHVELLESYFELAERRIKDRAALPSGDPTQLHEAAKRTIAEFKAKHHELDHKVVQPLIFIHPTFKSMTKIMDELEDFVTGELEKIPGLASSSSATALPPEVKLREFRRRFLHAFNEGHRKSLGLD